MENQDLIAICTVQSPMEAEIIRGVLESGGFACFIGGEGQSGLAGVLAIDVLTPAEDAERATTYLRKLKKFNKHLRKERHEAALEAKRTEASSDAIQELKPGSIMKPPERDAGSSG